jgi:hypothetical protein
MWGGANRPDRPNRPQAPIVSPIPMQLSKMDQPSLIVQPSSSHRPILRLDCRKNNQLRTIWTMRTI